MKIGHQLEDIPRLGKAYADYQRSLAHVLITTTVPPLAWIPAKFNKFTESLREKREAEVSNVCRLENSHKLIW